MLLWFVHSQDLSPMENVFSVVAKRLARQQKPLTIVHEIWHLVEAAWAAVLVKTMQSVFKSMPRLLTDIIAASIRYSGYRFLRILASKFLKILSYF